MIEYCKLKGKGSGHAGEEQSNIHIRIQDGSAPTAEEKSDKCGANRAEFYREPSREV